MQKELEKLIISSSCDGILTLTQQAALADNTGISTDEIENAAFDLGIVPLRFKRNLNAISLSEQTMLFNSKVTVVGCGGLGGYVLQELARLGVGNIQAWDSDDFEEHNLNRQSLAHVGDIGQSKVDVAARLLKEINPVTKFKGFKRRFVGEADEKYLAGASLVIDALDNAGSRLALAKVCRKLDLPLIHGAVNGWCGQLCTQFPEDTTIERIYEHYPKDKVGSAESAPAVLGFLPAVVASLQVAEAVKVILGRGELVRGRLMIFNLLNMDVDFLKL